MLLSSTIAIVSQSAAHLPAFLAMSESGSAVPAPAKLAKMTKTTVGMAAYAVTSSMMLIINKLAVTFFPHASVLLCLQLLATTAIIGVLSTTGHLNADAFEWEKARPFLFVALGFLGALYANVKTLQYANVETFIVFRCSVPLLVSVLDRFFLGRAWPNIRSWASLGVVSLGALAYVITDANFEVNAYGWVGVWYACFAFDAGTCRAFPKSKRDVYRPWPSALRP